MKKLITLIFALFVTAGIAYGQEKKVQVNNMAIIEQATANNLGDIEQNGTKSRARIAQGKLGRPFQDGFTAPFETPGADLGTANNNEAFIEQFGHYNLGIITQGIASGTAHSTAEIQQLADLFQGGNGNRGFIVQGVKSGTAVSNYTRVTQIGDMNTGLIGQGFNGGTAMRNEAYLFQYGDLNVGTVFQGGNGDTAKRNEAHINQRTNESIATILQGSVLTSKADAGAGYAFDNFASIRQYASKNNAKIFQGTDGNTSVSSASIKQYSNNNVAIIDQAGLNQNASIVQNN